MDVRTSLTIKELIIVISFITTYYIIILQLTEETFYRKILSVGVAS